VTLAQGPTVTEAELRLDALPANVSPSHREYFVLPARTTLAQVEREAIVQALRHSRGNPRIAARRLAIGEATLYRKCKVHHLASDARAVAW
jgi:DNA-binding NtrC family response regulator